MSSSGFNIQSQSLPDWLSYLERIHPSVIDLGLERVGQVAERLALTRLPGRVVTVGGTNGKGTTCAMLEAIYRRAGYQVGVYSSPHLLHYNERVRMNGLDVNDADLCRAFAAVEAARQDTSLTFFEFGTLAAFWLFREAELDLVILEVGLGGRLDATNLIDADVSVITSIALDHCDWLGYTREAIAIEKAGIYRANRPAISGEPVPPVTLAEMAERIGARLLQVNRDFHRKDAVDSWDFIGSQQQWTNLPYPALPLDNAVTALAAAEQLDLPLTVEAVRIGLATAKVPGRLQQVRQSPLVRIDVAHNPHAAAYLAGVLRRTPCDGRRIAVAGMLRDKDIRETLQQMLPVIQDWYLADLHGPRAASAADLAAVLAVPPVSCHGSVLDAYAAALASAGEQDEIIVFGSFHTVADVLAAEQNGAKHD